MNNFTRFAAFAALFLMYGCFTDVSNFGDTVALEPISSSTDIPSKAKFGTLTVDNHKGDRVTYDISHIDLQFGGCSVDGAEWCRALVNDCGTDNSLSYSFKDSDASAKTLSFRGLPRNSEMRVFADDQTFAFKRVGREITLRCSDCPFEANGREFKNRTVTLRALD